MRGSRLQARENSPVESFQPRTPRHTCRGRVVREFHHIEPRNETLYACHVNVVFLLPHSSRKCTYIVLQMQSLDTSLDRWESVTCKINGYLSLLNYQ